MTIQRPPKIWVLWFALVAGLIFFSVLCSGCATTDAYKGPDYSTPIVTREEHPRWNTETDPRAPHWEMRRFLRFENPLYRPVKFLVDCDNAVFHVDVPARTVKRLLITREDGDCKISRVPAL